MTRLAGIRRRDFLQGVALGIAAGTTLSPLELLARTATGQPYPPALTGLRGNHAGSFEALHALAGGGASFAQPAAATDDVYDLVVVGGGISGLAAAFLYRQAKPDARVLVLDNHDDFGGHAKRNEFTVDGRQLIGYGGSQSIDTPGEYSPAAARLLRDVGIDTGRFYDWFDQDFFANHGLGQAYFFAAERYGADSVHPAVVRPYRSEFAANPEALIEAYPLPAEAKRSFVTLLTEPGDFLAGLGADEKVALLLRTSYTDYLRKHAGVHDAVVVLLRDMVKGFWGVGYDALSAMEGLRLAMPGMAGLGLDLAGSGPLDRDEPYIFHFPDGNAGVARALVRRLVPGAVPGRTGEDLVSARVDYARLDRADNAVRIRLESSAVDVRHSDRGRAVDVTYVRQGATQRVRGRRAILACYHCVLPWICPEMPAAQVESIRAATKIPLVYLTIALRNWRAFAELGYHEFYVPQAPLMHTFGLDFPVSVGDYRYARSPDEPVVVHGTMVPTVPDQGLDERAQHVKGRARLYELGFDDFERDIVRLLDGALAKGGFDAGRDIAAITVNRWPHGYAYEYNELYDPPEWSRAHGPHRDAAARMGRISIANSDAMAHAYVDGAIDAADLAVREQLGG